MRKEIGGACLHCLPTGDLITDNYSKGKLETLSIGSYAKNENIKANFLGYRRESNGFPNGNSKMLPLHEKWAINVSTQYSCTHEHDYCDEAPSVIYLGNASFYDLLEQLYNAIVVFSDVKYTNRLNLHFTQMGDPAYNYQEVFEFSKWIYDNKDIIHKETGLRIDTLHPVFTTFCPSTEKMHSILYEWCAIKNDWYNGQAGLQLCINSTNEEQRKKMFDGKSLSLEEISSIAKQFPPPLGRKYTLNFAYHGDYEIDGEKLAKLFDPEFWIVKITLSNNGDWCENCAETKFHTLYDKPEKSCKKAGFDVLVSTHSRHEKEGTYGDRIFTGSEIKLQPF